MRLIIAGGRDFSDYQLMAHVLDELLDNANAVEPVQIVSGKARGADTLGERWAKDNDIAVKEFPALWDVHGKSAGLVRNTAMADYADGLIAFWDGKSRGTKHMIDTALSKGLRVYVVRY